MTSIWTGEKVRLRGGEPEDWVAAMAMDQDYRVMRNQDRLHPPRSAAGYRKVAESGGPTTPDDDQFGLSIESLTQQCLVGGISTGSIDKNAGTFQYGVTIGSAYHRRGYASEAIILLLRYMFAERRFQKCNVGIYAYNTASVALHEKLGFVHEGRLRRDQFVAGDYHDTVLMGITVEEFTELHSLGVVGEL